MATRARKTPSPDYRSLLETMLLIRRFEERASQAYGLRKIGGFLHLYIGQEAVATGAIATLDLAKDYVVTAYRDHGHAVACGLDTSSLMAELFGKATGCSRGKGGSMHFFNAEKHMLGGNGIVGSQIPVATGVALKIKYKKEGGVVLCFFGDGAIHQGSFHESLNMARIWNLPIVYICENNQYGMGTDYRRVSAVADFSVMGGSYGIPGKQVNGMDVLEVYHEVDAAVSLARAEGMPGFLEIRTYRYRGHSMSDPAKYRTKDEVASYKEQDPILLLKDTALREKRITDEEYTAMDAQAKKQAEDAVQFAESSPDPSVDSLYEDVLA
ncbi:MAG: pyruvate dehydrogenase (acetyl-transferring) E1 component subunit alpha [Chitinivibrionales bacterium]|nr:pyruvate dehydrogenase (acetyl-transferring) E1 component subunit alpha [Chitinivibrionales bacterium]MBD3396445.1 pyruvate dehydrogenase (acetyl-transferring) E1 component subunit alpha [Chitinivibrionales bacterium]